MEGSGERDGTNLIDHILKKDPADNCAVALGPTPEGRRNRDNVTIMVQR